ncbi:NFATC2-interacting protein [Cocos nucifera]|uniref:NFATC2-interacting protein n=1 Tax=Cocos nucifera TaxID=13894 RepID=A0A8K0IUZ1_COCNU|nr:NFATC2-interacting protein [Cocos nucifera]
MKRKKAANRTDGKVKESRKDVVVLDDEEKGGKEREEEDWLPPSPQSIPSSGLALQEDKTLRELRLQKQELASLAQSAQDVLRAVMESAKTELSSSGKPAPEVKTSQPSKPLVERKKIVISIQGKDGQKQFRVYSDDKFERLFKMYAEKAQLKLENLVFCFDGDKVSPTETPEGLGLENDDMLEVHVKSR